MFHVYSIGFKSGEQRGCSGVSGSLMFQESISSHKNDDGLCYLPGMKPLPPKEAWQT